MQTGNDLYGIIPGSLMNSMNPLMGIFPITAVGNILLACFAAGVVVFDRIWRRFPENRPAAYREVTVATKK